MRFALNPPVAIEASKCHRQAAQRARIKPWAVLGTFVRPATAMRRILWRTSLIFSSAARHK
jgi:hypothetical protein